jgi:hypothetical protein
MPTMSCALTRLLRDACGGSSRTAVLVTLSPHPSDSKITLHSLQFALSVSRVHNRSQFVSSHAQPSIVQLFGLSSLSVDSAVSSDVAEGLHDSPLSQVVSFAPWLPIDRVLTSSARRFSANVRRWSRIRAYAAWLAPPRLTC